MTGAPSLVVNYGENAALRVEFRLAADGATIEGRYLEGADGVGRRGEWEPRTVDESSDEAHVAILAALREVLEQYAGGDHIEEPSEDLSSSGRPRPPLVPTRCAAHDRYHECPQEVV